MSEVPPEIIEAILSYLDEDAPSRQRDLRQCALVSRSWCCIAQPLLFSFVKITKQHWSKQIPASLLRIVEEGIHIRGFIHTLSIEVDDAAVSASFLNLLSDLRGLRLLSPGEQPTQVLTPDLVRCLSNIFQSDRFTSLSLSLLRDVPISIFTHCVALEELALSRVLFSGLNAVAPECDGSTPRRRTQLKTLVIFNIYTEELDFISWLLGPNHPFDLSGVKTFLAMDRSDSIELHRLICEFIELVSDSVENLLIDPPLDVQEIGGILRSECLKNLRTIKLWLLQDHEDGINILPAILDLLQKLPNPGILEEVELLAEFATWGDTEGRSSNAEIMHSMKWTEFDTLMTSPAFQSLKSVKITVHELYDDATGPLYVDLFNKALTALFGSGKLSIETTRDPHYVTRHEKVWFR